MRRAKRNAADGVVSSGKYLRQTDHPVCGISVASRLFIAAAASPPLRGGEYGVRLNELRLQASAE